MTRAAGAGLHRPSRGGPAGAAGRALADASRRRRTQPRDAHAAAPGRPGRKPHRIRWPVRRFPPTGRASQAEISPGPDARCPSTHPAGDPAQVRQGAATIWRAARETAPWLQGRKRSRPAPARGPAGREGHGEGAGPGCPVPCGCRSRPSGRRSRPEHASGGPRRHPDRHPTPAGPPPGVWAAPGAGRRCRAGAGGTRFRHRPVSRRNHRCRCSPA